MLQRVPVPDLPTDQFLEHPGHRTAHAESPTVEDVHGHLQRKHRRLTVDSIPSESCLPTLCSEKPKDPGGPEVTTTAVPASLKKRDKSLGHMGQVSHPAKPH